MKAVNIELRNMGGNSLMDQIWIDLQTVVVTFVDEVLERSGKVRTCRHRPGPQVIYIDEQITNTGIYIVLNCRLAVGSQQGQVQVLAVRFAAGDAKIP